jgi:phage tail sheath protein FI
MPVTPSYPGVYIEELSSGTRTVVGVPSSIAAFVGYTPRGRDNRAVRVQSFADYERAFGGLDTRSEVGYAVEQFFLNSGTEAYVVRVPKSDAVAGVVRLQDGTGAGAKPALQVTANSRGAWANDVVVEVDHGVPAGDARAFTLTVTDLATGATERFGNVTLDPARTNYVKTVVNDPDSGSAMVSVDVPDATAGRPAQTGTVGGDVTLSSLANDKAYSVKVSSDVPTGQISGLNVEIVAAGEALPASVAGLAALVERKLNAALSAAVAGARVRVVPSPSGLGLRVIADFDPVRLPGAVDATLTFAAGTPDNLAALRLTGAPATVNLSRYRLGLGRTVQAQTGAVAGVDGVALPGSSQLLGSPAAFTGIHALRKVDLFTLLSIPDATRASPGDPHQLDTGLDPNAIWAGALALCTERRAMLLVDPPPSASTVDSALDWISAGLTAKGRNATAYWPRLRVPDPLNGFQPRTVAPSGTIAGLCARVDADRGVWKAPAGTDARLANVAGLDYVLTDAETGVLNPLGLNCLRRLPVYGTVSWGARTLDGADAMASEWKYLPVRRLALTIEESVFRGSQWAVFEPNDEPLWAQLRLSLTSYMHSLFRQGAFAGQTPREAYLVKCDAQTTTPDDVDRGIVNVLVGFAPLKPAEFVFIRFQQLAGQSPS